MGEEKFIVNNFPKKLTWGTLVIYVIVFLGILSLCILIRIPLYYLKEVSIQVVSKTSDKAIFSTIGEMKNNLPDKVENIKRVSILSPKVNSNINEVELIKVEKGTIIITCKDCLKEIRVNDTLMLHLTVKKGDVSLIYKIFRLNKG